MTTEDTSWTIRHFTQCNVLGPGQDDVPALLRRIASSIEELGPVTVQDVVFHEGMSGDGGAWPSMTVYFHPADATGTTLALVAPLDDGAPTP